MNLPVWTRACNFDASGVVVCLVGRYYLFVLNIKQSFKQVQLIKPVGVGVWRQRIVAYLFPALFRWTVSKGVFESQRQAG